MSTASAATKHSAPPAPPPVVASPAAPATPAAPPPRQLRPLAPSQIQLAEYATRHHVVTLPVGTEFADALRPEFWSNVADRLRVCDKVDIFDARGTVYGELLVRSVAQTRPVQGVKGAVQMHLLRHVELDPPDRKLRPPTHVVEYRGPADLWTIIRISDGAVVAHHLESREIAEQHLARMAMAPA
jgi:hypothetical protein